jgi:hypothetical protein
MGTTFVRRIYCALLRLHPGGFRGRFGAEMLYAFDDAAELYGASWLLRDLAISLVRQRVFRSREDDEAFDSQEQIGLMAGAYPLARPPHLTVGKLSLALVLSALLMMLIRPL